MRVKQTSLPGVLLITPVRHEDDRGFFAESWSRTRMIEAGLDLPDFVQDSHSMSYKGGTVRGLHFQAPPRAQGKLVRCGRGSLFDVAVDFRAGSPTFGRWVGAELSADNGCQIWIPAGFLHGFVTREPNTEIVYKATSAYAPQCEGTVRWDSAILGIEWNVSEPILSAKDAGAPDFDAVQSPFVFGEAGG